VSVASSNIVSIGYDEPTKTLEIEFKDHHVYEYFEVPPSEFDGLVSASSHGKYFYAHIKDHYTWRQIS
jgi:KTSC domain